MISGFSSSLFCVMNAFLLFDLVNGLRRDFNFRKIALRIRPSVIAARRDIQDPMVCAVACSSARENSECTAFQMMEEICYIFTGTIEEKMEDPRTYTAAETAYKMLIPTGIPVGILGTRPSCEAHPGFRVVATADESFCVRCVFGKSNYDEALAECHSRDSTLAFVGTREKHTVLHKLATAEASSQTYEYGGGDGLDDYYIINARYDFASNTYKGERPGDVITLDSDMWGPRYPRDPRFHRCVVIEVDSVTFGNSQCEILTQHYFCEIFDFSA